MDWVTDIKKSIKRVIYSRIFWIVLLNLILILFPIGGITLIRSKDYRDNRSRTSATRELGRSIIKSVDIIKDPIVLRFLPRVAPYQRVLLLESENLKILYDTNWITNYPLNSFEYDLPLTQFIAGFVSDYPEPVMDQVQILERLKPYITERKKRLSIIEYRYLYLVDHFNLEGEEYTFIVLTDKSDLMESYRVNKVLMFLLSIISTGLGLIVSMIYYHIVIKPLKILTKDAQRIKDKRELTESQFRYRFRLDEIGILSKTFYLTTEELINRNRSFELFTNDILHELKNPLTTIRNSIEILEYDKEFKEREELYKLIASESARVEKLLYDIREFSLFTKAENIKTLCYPHIILPKILELYTTFHIRYISESEKPVKLSEEQFVSVITNLIDNAISFSPEPGSISVVYTGDNLSVKDGGPGISKENRERVFDRFYTDRVGEIAPKHSGLGLSIVKTILENNHYSIRCEDNLPTGAHFFIKL